MSSLFTVATLTMLICGRFGKPAFRPNEGHQQLWPTGWRSSGTLADNSQARDSNTARAIWIPYEPTAMEDRRHCYSPTASYVFVFIQFVVYFLSPRQ
jgi:hypothetical protein